MHCHIQIAWYTTYWQLLFWWAKLQKARLIHFSWVLESWVHVNSTRFTDFIHELVFVAYKLMNQLVYNCQQFRSLSSLQHSTIKLPILVRHKTSILKFSHPTKAFIFVSWWPSQVGECVLWNFLWKIGQLIEGYFLCSFVRSGWRQLECKFYYSLWFLKDFFFLGCIFWCFWGLKFWECLCAIIVSFVIISAIFFT